MCTIRPPPQSTHKTHSPPCQMGIQQLRLEGHQIKGNSNVITDKAAPAGHGAAGLLLQRTDLHFLFHMTFTKRCEQDPVLHHPWNKFLPDRVVFT